MGKKVTKDQVMGELRSVIDPELRMDIVSLGLVYGVELERPKVQEGGGGGTKVKVVMTLTTPGCPLAGVFERMVKEAVKKIPGVGRVEVELTWEPVWDIERMSEEARAELGF